MTAPVHAFADAQLDADLAAVLGIDAGAVSLTDHRHTRSERPSPTRLPSSRRASATGGAALALVVMASTGWLLFHQSGDQTDEPRAARSMASSSPASVIKPIAPSTATRSAQADGAQGNATFVQQTIVRKDASPGEKAVASVSIERSRVRNATLPQAIVDSTPADATLAFEHSAPPVEALSQVEALPVALETRPDMELAELNNDSMPKRAADIENPPARARRDSVVAIRALRRQW